MGELTSSAISAGPGTSADLQFAVNRDMRAAQILELDLMRRWFQGTARVMTVIQISHVGGLLELLPPGFSLDRLLREDFASGFAASSQDRDLVVILSNEVAQVMVLADTEAVAEEVVGEVRAMACGGEPDGLVGVHIWNGSADGRGTRVSKRLTAPDWAVIERNYPPGTRRALGRLMQLERPHASGRLVLMHGAPGTGKTTAVRALMKIWEPWCQPAYISDPERLFGNPAYLNHVLTYGSAVESSAARWTLVMAEDTDDFIRPTPGRTSSPALGRLLNTADGILGQGSNAIILLTTNEPLAALHPAVSRPGRCLSIVDFPRFSPAEAREWLAGSGAMPDGQPTLAQLLVARGDIRPVDGDPPEAERQGVYL